MVGAVAAEAMFIKYVYAYVEVEILRDVMGNCQIPEKIHTVITMAIVHDRQKKSRKDLNCLSKPYVTVTIKLQKILFF